MAKLIDPKYLKYSKAKDSPLIRDLKKDTELNKKINRVEEWNSIYQSLKDPDIKKRGTLESVREAMYKLKNQGGDFIERDEAMAIANKLIKSGRKFEKPESASDNIIAKKEAASNNLTFSRSRYQSPGTDKNIPLGLRGNSASSKRPTPPPRLVNLRSNLGNLGSLRK